MPPQTLTEVCPFDPRYFTWNQTPTRTKPKPECLNHGFLVSGGGKLYRSFFFRGLANSFGNFHTRTVDCKPLRWSGNSHPPRPRKPPPCYHTKMSNRAHFFISILKSRYSDIWRQNTVAKIAILKISWGARNIREQMSSYAKCAHDRNFSLEHSSPEGNSNISETVTYEKKNGLFTRFSSIFLLFFTAYNLEFYIRRTR